MQIAEGSHLSPVFSISKSPIATKQLKKFFIRGMSFRKTGASLRSHFKQ